MAADRVTELSGITPLARWRGAAAVGCDPRTMGLGPVFAIRRLLERQQLALAEVDRVEINEAFAVQTLACLRELAFRGRARQCEWRRDRAGASAGLLGRADFDDTVA